MWHDTYLRFHDETDYLATMPPVLRWVGPHHAEDVLGPINGLNYHVNLRLIGQELPAELVAYQLAPPNFPRRVWA
jgi:hypothetical protein